MSPWTALLESLHSALIDELNERLPKEKPELGLPQRQKLLAWPAPDLSSAVICEISFVREEATLAAATASTATGKGDSRGFAALACDAEFTKKLGLDPRALWSALARRAGKEFMFRKIQPRLDRVDDLPAPGALPAGYPVPGRVIWIPFRIGTTRCYLGVGA